MIDFKCLSNCSGLFYAKSLKNSFPSPTRGHASVGRLIRTYLHQLSADAGCSLEDLLGAIDDWDGLREKESGKSVLSARLVDDDDDDSLKFFFFAYSITISIMHI